MSNAQALSQLAFALETTQGDPPGDAAAWLAEGTQLRHIAESLDPSGIVRESLEDLRSQSTLQGTEQRVTGIDNPEFTFEVYPNGLGVVTPDASQVPAEAIHNLIGNAMGGQSRGTSRIVAGGGHTTTDIGLDSVATVEEGEFVAIQFATPVGNFPATASFVRRVVAVNALIITVDQALPATPVDGDIVHGVTASFIDEDRICDSDGPGGPFTLSWLIQKGFPGTGVARREAWEIRGAVTTMQAFSFTRGETAKMSFQIMGGSHADPSTAPWPVWPASPAPGGFAPFPIGPLHQTWLEDFGTSTNTLVNLSTFEVEPGIPRVRVETVTSTGSTMEATAGYASEPTETTVTVGIDPLTIDKWAEQAAATFKALRWTNNGPPGAGFAVHFSKVSYVQEPARGVNNATTRTDVQLKAHPDEQFGATATNTKRARSKLIILGW